MVSKGKHPLLWPELFRLAKYWNLPNNNEWPDVVSPKNRFIPSFMAFYGNKKLKMVNISHMNCQCKRRLLQYWRTAQLWVFKLFPMSQFVNEQGIQGFESEIWVHGWLLTIPSIPPPVDGCENPAPLFTHWQGINMFQHVSTILLLVQDFPTIHGVLFSKHTEPRPMPAPWLKVGQADYPLVVKHGWRIHSECYL